MKPLTRLIIGAALAFATPAHTAEADRLAQNRSKLQQCMATDTCVGGIIVQLGFLIEIRDCAQDWSWEGCEPNEIALNDLKGYVMRGDKILATFSEIVLPKDGQRYKDLRAKYQAFKVKFKASAP